MKICAIVVTFKRLNLLKKTLNALLKQKKLNDIIIVINGSPDEILNYFKKFNYKKIFNNLLKIDNFKTSNKNLFIKVKYKNSGSAGGFYEGIELGYELNYDWLWLMDDDIEPVKDALEILLSYTSSKIKCVHAKRKFLNGEEAPLGIMIDQKTSQIINYDPFKYLKRDFCELGDGCWEGMLIHRDVVKQIGFPDKKFYFYNDDAYYGYLASKYTMNILINKYLYIKNVKPKFVEIPIFNIKIFRPKSDVIYYYWIRNKFLLLDKIKKEGNLSRTAYLILIKDLVITLGAILILDRSLKRLFYFFRGIFDGLRKRYGRGFYRW